MLTGVTFAPSPARAQFLWAPTDTRPRPNAIIGYDTSAAMGVLPGCNPVACHVEWLPNIDTVTDPAAVDFPFVELEAVPWSETREARATGELAQTLRYFKNDFIFGGFRYDSCGPDGQWLGHIKNNTGGYSAAHILHGPNVGEAEARETDMWPPDLANPIASYDNVVNMVNDIATYNDVDPNGPTGFSICEHAEGGLPDQPGVLDPWLNDLHALQSGGLIGSVQGNDPCGIPNGPLRAIQQVAICAAYDENRKIGKALKDQPSNVINGNCRENALMLFTSGAFGGPSLVGNVSAACINPSCSDDSQWLTDEFNHLGSWVPGVQLPKLGSQMTTPVPCDKPNQAGSYQMLLEFSSVLGANAFSMQPDPAHPGQLLLSSATNFCNLMGSAITKVQTDLNNCSSSPPDWLTGYTCTATIVQTQYCTAAHNAQTCACAPASCPPPAVPQTNFVGAYIEAQRATNPFSAYGNPAGGPPYYSPTAHRSNAFVLQAGAPPAPSGNPVIDTAGSALLPGPLATALGQPAPLDAFDQSQLQLQLSMILNRLRFGFYTNSTASFDRWGDRAVTSSYDIFGTSATYPDERYIGRPTRLSFWAVDPQTGIFSTSPICETDWASKAVAPGPLLLWDGSFPATVPPALQPVIGPPAAGQNWASGQPILTTVSDNGRNGHPSNPASGGFRYGLVTNGATTQPVIVDAPHDLPKVSGAEAQQFATFETQHRTRDRVVYTMAGGYLIGFNAGTYNPLPSSLPVFPGGPLESYNYTESFACREEFRYLPSWVANAAADDGSLGLRVAQTYAGGQIVVREAQVAQNGDPGDFATVLVMTQGPSGPNFSVLDVTEPSQPGVFADASLPSVADRTTALPAIYTFPNGVAGQVETVVVMPGGNGGASSLYAFKIARSGVSLISQALLPAGNYPSSAVCFDEGSTGATNRCVVLSDQGHLVKVAVDSHGNFGNVVDLYGSYTVAPGQVFYTPPAVYFTADNKLAYVFGSGDVTNLELPPPVPNQIYKVIDAQAGNMSSHSVSSASSCVGAGPFGSSGVIDLATPNEVVLSPPIVAGGVVAWTTYTPHGISGCGTGHSSLYAMDFQTCRDAVNNANPRPQPLDAGSGIAFSPVYQRLAGAVFVQTSDGRPTQIPVAGSSRARRSRAMPLYLRYVGRT